MRILIIFFWQQIISPVGVILADNMQDISLDEV